MKKILSYFVFNQQKDIEKKTKEFIKQFEDQKIPPRNLYTNMLNQIFQNMRDKSITDEEIDIILTQALYPSNEFMYVANNN